MHDAAGGVLADRQLNSSPEHGLRQSNKTISPRLGEAHYRAIFESAGDFAIFTTDLEGTITSWNPGAEKLLGWQQEEAVGQHACMIFTREDQANDACGDEMRQALQFGRAEDERWHVKSDGSRFWASGLMMRFENEGTGEHVGYLKVLRNRTPQHESEERLRASEEFNRRVLASSADCIKVLDLDGRLEFMSEGGMCVMEVDDFAAIAGARWTEFWQGNEHAKALAAVEEAMRGGAGRFQGFATTMKNNPRWWDVAVTPINGADGRPEKLLSVSRDITATKQVEEAHRETTRRLDAILSNTREAVFLMDERQQCVYANAAAEALTGYSVPELQGRPLHDVVHHTRPDGRHYPLEECPIDRAFPERSQMSGEELFVAPDGSFYPVAFTASPVLDEDGCPIGTVIEARNIAEDKAREEALRTSEARMRKVLEIETVGVVFFDFAGGIREANDAFLTMVGHTREELEAGEVRYEHLTPPDWRWRDEQTIAELKETGSASPFEKEYTRKDGSRIWILCADKLIDDQTAVEFIVDVTDRRRAEEARRHSEVRLRELNETLERRVEQAIEERDRTWDNARDLLVVVDVEGRFRAVNPAWTDVLGWSEADLLGRPVFDFVHGDDLETTRSALGTAKAGPLSPVENRYLHKDGSHRWISWVAAPSGDAIYANGRDVTTEKEREVELAQAQEQLRQAQKMEAVGQLTGGIAHDFNNLLTGVIGSLDMMQRQLVKGETDKIERYANIAMTSANRAAALTHRLLAFSRRQPLDPKPVNANKLVTGMEELLRRTLGEAIHLEMVTAGGLWLTRCDPNQLESAVLNLAINARDAMADGGTLTVEPCNAHLDDAYAARSREVRPGQYVCICVSDTGSGMTPEVISKAFEPFYTTKPIGQGTGLGLSMIYGFARQSEGYAKIYSEPGKGTTIKLYLPRYYGEGEHQEDVSPGLSEEHRAEHGEVVLVVEDESAVRDLVVDVLEELGYRAVQASDGLTGLKMLQTDMRVDLLVTDVGLPGLNGRQLADHAREHRPDLKVLFMTGYAGNAAIANGFLEPGMQMITKPFAVEALANRIRKMIEGASG
jgi:PAS domain S-box-containing protein